MADQAAVKFSNPSRIHQPFGYSHVAEVTRGKLIFLAGQVALDASGNLVGPDDFGAQIRQVFANIQAALEAAGADFSNVIKLNYYCADTVDPSEMATVRAVRDSFVNTANPPVSTFLVVRRLARPGWLIEIEAVAAV